MIRRNPITGAPVLLAPERLLRPHALGGDEEIVCPFCPGHERETPPEIWRDGDPWSIRVFPNKYPATERHEIVVETADHDAGFEDLDRAAGIVDAWLDRYRALSPAIIFKNHGRAAGASLTHAHSQILGTPFVPPRLAAEAAAFVAGLRSLDLAKPPGLAETIDWARALGALGKQELDVETVEQTLGSVLKYREDLLAVRDEALAGLVAQSRAR